jgi:sortase A
MFTAGLIMLFFAGYQIYGKQFETNAEQDRLLEAMGTWDEEDDEVEAEPLPGEAHSRMFFPTLDMDWVVVSGVTQADIEYGPGHYPGTAEPGEVGNYSVAGHRVPAVFWDLDLLNVGDEVVLEDRDSYYTYRVTESHVVTPDQIEVVDPNPYDPGAEPEDALLTITTCEPKLNNTHRLIVHAELEESHPKEDGVPESIRDMVGEEA